MKRGLSMAVKHLQRGNRRCSIFISCMIPEKPLELVDVTVTGKLIAEIDGKHYMLRSWEAGCWRADMVDRGLFGWWSACDDDDWIIRNGVVIAREIGWERRRENVSDRRSGPAAAEHL